jgi:tetratricopeptide (TPR) repeat protein
VALPRDLPDERVDALRASLDRALDNDRVHRRFGLAVRQYRAIRRLLGTLGAEPSHDVAELHVRALIGESRCLSELGADTATCLELLEHARRWAEAADDKALVALVQGRRGLLSLRRGNLESALDDFDAAETGLPDGADLGAVYLNRGSLHLERGALDQAVRDFERCVSITQGLEPALHTMAAHNLGYALYLRGDLPAALRSMHAAAEVAPPEHAGVGLVDKAAVLYEAGLRTEAEQALRRATQLLADGRASRDLLDARLAHARCLVGLGRFDEARALAKQVARSARRTGHETLARQSRLIELEARLGSLRDAPSPRVPLRRVASQARELGTVARNDPSSERLAVPALLIEAEAAALDGSLDRAGELLRQARPMLRQMPVGSRLQVETVRAMVAFRTGNRRQGIAAVRRGERLLVSQRERLGAVEAVTAAAAHGARLTLVDVHAAIETGRPDAIFDAIERGRAAFAGSGRVRPPDDPVAARLLVEARQVLERARLLGHGADAEAERTRLRREARRLQDQARERAWHDDGVTHVAETPTARGLRDELRAASSDRTVLDLGVVDDRVLGVRVDRSGAAFFDLASLDVVRERARRVRADLQVLSNGLIPEPLRSAALGSIERNLRWLDDALLAPIGARGPLYVAARGFLVSLPWAALPSRRGLSTVVNSLVARGTADWAPGRTLVVSGPDLRNAPSETAAVAGTWGGDVVRLDRDAATCAGVRSAIAHTPVVHIAAHGTHEPDNALFSSLRLADGPLFAHELDGVDLTRSVLVLSACDVGSASAHFGGEPLGLTSVLLRMGARAVIASVAPLRDDVAARVMPALHAELRDGARPGEALARALAVEPEPVPLVCFGPLVL